MSKKRFPLSRAGWVAHDRRAARGLHEVAARLATSSSEEEIQAALATVEPDDQAELAELIAEHARDERAIVRGLQTEDPSEAVAARLRARTWRLVRRRLPRAGRVRVGGQPRAFSSTRTPGRRPDRRSNRADAGDGSSVGPAPPDDLATRVGSWRALAADVDAWLAALARALIAASRRRT